MLDELTGRFRLGDWDVAALSDGIGAQQPRDWFPGVADEAWMAATGVTDPSAVFPVNFGSFLLRRGDRTVLVDTGNGPRTRGAHPGAAGLLDRLAELGVLPAQIDTVLLTHFHGDHVGWNTLEADGGEVTFPQATFWLHEADLKHLARPEAREQAGDVFSRGKIWPVRQAGRLRTFDGERSPLPGITFLPTPGHTPGHCSVLVESGRERLVIVGDAAPHVAHLEHPEWSPVFDLDGPGAVESRQRLAGRAAMERMLVTGGHFPILTVGRLSYASADPPRFAWEPVDVEAVGGGMDDGAVT